MLAGDAQNGAIGSVMTFSNTWGGNGYRYCRSYNFTTTTTGFFSASFWISGIGPDGFSDYLATYITLDGALQAAQFQNYNTASGGFSVSAAASDILVAGAHTVQFCGDLAGNLTSVSVGYRFKVLG